ncbi:MAG TPA: DUF1565 domain-containing protein, partial [Kofleriaceae bacterium]|nr:DUF1565 domain-containing protein [Kofleriaceae bacterium]
MRGLATWLVMCCGCYHPNAASNVPCSSTGDCPGSQVCDEGQSPPVCVASIADAATIDGDQQAGQPCSRDSDCESSVCAETDGTCVDAGQSLFVAPTGDDANQCSQTMPCATISRALERVNGGRHTIRVANGAYTDAFVITGGTSVLISGEVPDYAGTDITYDPSRLHDHVVEAQGTDIRIEGMGIHGGTAETLRSDSDLSLHHVAVFDSAQGGIDCNGCTLHLVDSLVSGHTLFGVDAHGDASVSIHRSKITGNAGGGVRVTTADFDISSSFLVHNGKAGAMAAQAFVVANTTATDPARFAFNTLSNNASGGVSCGIPTTLSS